MIDTSHYSASLGKFTPGCWRGGFGQSVKPQIQEGPFGFSPGRGTVEQLITLLCSLTAPWEFAHSVCMCFVDPERAHNNPVFGFHEQDLEVQPRTVMCPTREPHNYASAFYK